MTRFCTCTNQTIMLVLSLLCYMKVELHKQKVQSVINLTKASCTDRYSAPLILYLLSWYLGRVYLFFYIFVQIGDTVSHNLI